MFKRKDVSDDCLHNATPLRNFAMGWMFGITPPALTVVGVLSGCPFNIIGILTLCGCVYMLYAAWIERATWYYYAGCICMWIIFILLR